MAQLAPFVIPPTGPVSGSAVDQSSLNEPIQRIVRNGAHFEKLDSKQRIRFFGLNIAGPDLFAANHDQIEATVRRLAAMGCNVVRLHHLDNMWENPVTGRFGARTRQLSRLIRSSSTNCTLPSTNSKSMASTST